MHHWRFEPDAAIGWDCATSDERADLDAVGAVGSVGLDGTAFPRGFTTSSAVPNRSAADFLGGVLTNDRVASMVSSFTLEAFIHMRTAVDTNGDVIVAMGDQFGGHYSLCSWGLVVRYDRVGGTQPRELAAHLYEGGGSPETIGSGFVLDIDTDFYIAAAVDLPGRQITFWKRDLTHRSILERSVRVHHRSALNTSSRLSVGDDGTGVSGLSFDGLIDEVRISDVVLPEDQLLVSKAWAQPVPASPSWMICFTALALAVSGSWFARRRSPIEANRVAW